MSVDTEMALVEVDGLDPSRPDLTSNDPQREVRSMVPAEGAHEPQRRPEALPAIPERADVANIIPGLKRRHSDRITGELTIPARPARYAPFPADLDPRLIAALRSRGVEQLYSHQRAAWDVVA